MRSTSAQALAPIFEAACAYATASSVGGKPVPPDMRRMPQQLFSSVCNTVVKQLAEERAEPETMLALADALSDVTCAAYSCLSGGEAGANAPRLTESEGRQLVQSLAGLAAECLERRRQLYEGMAGAQDEDERFEYQEALDTECELLTPLVDSIGYTLKSAGPKFARTFDAVVGPAFSGMLEGGDDTRAR